jgi:hypothetical protein
MEDEDWDKDLGIDEKGTENFKKLSLRSGASQNESASEKV